MRQLDVQHERRRRTKRILLEKEWGLSKTRAAHRKILDDDRLDNQKPVWTYADPMPFFERPPKFDGTASQTHTRKFVNGIYNTDDPAWRPPHYESNKKTNWQEFSRNIRNEALGEFGSKPVEMKGGPSKMTPQEVMYHERLQRSLEKSASLVKEDALDKTVGHRKKAILHSSADEFSCLSRKKEAWTVHRVSHHVYFSKAEPQPAEDYDPHLMPYIVQPERATNYQRDIVVGNQEQKSFWRQPQENPAVTQRQFKARTLLHPRGVAGVKPSATLSGTRSGAGWSRPSPAAAATTTT